MWTIALLTRGSKACGPSSTLSLSLAKMTPTQSEADTRAKLIDPVFIDALGCTRSTSNARLPSRTAMPTTSFGKHYAWFHVEAKRTLPRFNLHVPSRTRRLKLSGPHLLGNKTIKPLLDQARKYSFDLGTEFTILTNGSQFILFQSIVRGHRWEGDSA